MNPRPSSMLVRCALTLAMLSLAACILEEPSDGPRMEEPGPNENLEQPLVDVTCFTEDPGCGCMPGTPPIDCTLTEVRGDLVLCEAGASYCVEGVWSECETVESWEVPRHKVITTPGACTPCSPDCFQTNDTPDQADLTNPPPTNITHDNVEFVTGPHRGIRPQSTGGGGSGMTLDSDGDGVPNVADNCPADAGVPQFFGCSSGVGTGGFFHVLPPGASAIDPLTFNVQLREADVYILVDRTGSMGGEIDNLRTGLASIISSIRTTIPDTWFGVGRFDDVPDGNYGTTSSSTNRMYYNVLDLTSSLSAAQTAVNTLATIPSGGDWPEANSQALYSMASGLGLNLFGTQYYNARTGCPAGRWGYPCFRPNVIPLVILITDAESHNGPTGIEYGSTPPTTTALTTSAHGNDNTNPNLGTLPAGQIRELTGSTQSATNDNTVRCTSSNDTSRDRLFQFAVTQAGVYEFDSIGSSYDVMLSLYAGTVLNATTLRGCDDNTAGTSQAVFSANLTAGTYTLRVDGNSNDQGNFVVRITPPRPNLGNLSGVMREYRGNTLFSANSLTGRCSSGNADTSRDRLVEFNVTTRAEYRFDLSGSDFDSMMGLYSGTAPTAGLLACDDDSGSGDTSRITQVLDPGTYTLRIDGYSNDQGNFVLTAGQTLIPEGIPYATAMAAMNARNIRFIGVNSGNSVARADLESMAADTNSLDGNGTAFVEDINSDGSGLTTAIVTAVQNLANYARMDVDVVVQNINILPGIPASALVQSITLGAPGCATRCTGAITNGCSQCLPGTNLPFSVTFRNDVIMPTSVDQVFNFDLIVRGNLGAIELQRVPVRIVVPRSAPGAMFGVGSFTRTFAPGDHAPGVQPTCEIPPTRPDWGLFAWEVTTPGDSHVVFEIRTAETKDALSSTSGVSFTVPGTGPMGAIYPPAPTAAQYVDVGDLITMMGGYNYLPYLRVTATLHPSSNGLQAPTLTSMGLQFSCVDSE